MIEDKSKHFQDKLYEMSNYFECLKHLIDKKNFPKVLMLNGKKGQGKFTMVHHLLSYYFDCKNYDTKSLIINNNNFLFKNIKTNINNDILYFNCSEQSIKIDNIRELKNTLQKTSINKFNRFILFDDVEYLSNNCVNALLKSIEEPNKINHFILINNKSRPIIETLKSRSLELNIYLNKSKKLKIIENLLKDQKINNVDENLKNTALTPGEFLIFNDILNAEDISLGDNITSNVNKLFLLSKKKKNIIYINFAIYLINIHFMTKAKNNFNIDECIDRKSYIIKKLIDADKLNLNYKNTISELESYY